MPFTRWDRTSISGCWASPFLVFWYILVMSLMIVFGFPPLILGSILLELERAAEHGPFTWINVALLFSTLAVTGLLLYWANGCWRAARAGIGRASPSRLFIARLGAGINLTGAIATLSLGMMALLLSPCL